MDIFIVFGVNSSVFSHSKIAELYNLWGDDIVHIQDDDFSLYYRNHHNNHYLLNDSDALGCIDGWVGYDNLPLNASVKNFYFSLMRDWPLRCDNFSGTFSGLVYQKSTHLLRLFSDLSGIVPFYFFIGNGIIMGSTSLVLLGRILELEIDTVGVIQRLSPPDYINFGSRTVLKNVYRLLPGEMIVCDINCNIEKKYDNSLYDYPGVTDLAKYVDEFWHILKADVLLSVVPYEKLGIGMSGGWDSRLILGALQDSTKELTCFTYGMSQDEYEVKISQKCAEIVGANFVFCDIKPDYFPNLLEFSENMKSSDSTFVTCWFSLLNSCAKNAHLPILLGDMFEAIVGRNIKRLTNRRARINSFLGLGSRLKSNHTQPPAFFDKAKLFESFVDTQIKQINYLSVDLMYGKNIRHIKDELLFDLEVVYQRVLENTPSSGFLTEELFGWFTHGHSMARQFWTLKPCFSPVSATMGSRLLKNTVRVSPAQRADGSFLHEIQKIPELQALSNLPATAIPFVPSSSPLLIKNVVWGGRSLLDQFLIKRAVKNRSQARRQRVVKSLDFVHLYSQPGVIPGVESWFSGKWIRNSNEFVDIVKNRALLRTWPLANFDVVGPASVSILLDLIFER